MQLSLDTWVLRVCSVRHAKLEGGSLRAFHPTNQSLPSKGLTAAYSATTQYSTAQVSACRFTSVCVIGAVGTFREKGRVWKGFSWSRFGHFMTMDLEGQVPLYLIIDTRHRKPRARRGFDVVGGHMSALDLKAHQRGQDNSRRILPSDDRDWADKEVNNKA